MSSVLSCWPFLILLGVIGGLWYMRHTGRTRPALPVITVAQVPRDDSDHGAEMIQLAELVRSGAFYVSGAVLDWGKCMEFAAKIVKEVERKEVERGDHHLHSA